MKFHTSNPFVEDSKSKLIYFEDEYGLDTIIPNLRPHYGCICVNTLQIDLFDGKELMRIRGFCPLTALRPSTEKYPTTYRSQRLLVTLDNEVVPGVSYGVNDEEWELYINREKGWVCIGDTRTEGRQLIHFAPGAVMALEGDQAVALWIKPEKLPQSGLETI